MAYAIQDKLLTETEASEMIGFSKNTLRAWRVTGRPSAPPPPFLKCGRSVRYQYSALLEWINQQPSLTSTSQQATA